jgi:DNA-binding NarL/FixJ family response regulator
MSGEHERTVLVADDSGELSQAIAQSFTVLTGADIGAVLRLARSVRPVAVVVDGEFPPEGGISTIARLAPLALPTVLALARTDGAVLAAALRSGAHSIVATGGSADRLQRAIQAAVRGDLFLGPELAGEVYALVDGEPDDRHPFPQLSPRERDVLTELACGADARRIAIRLGVSEKTARNQLARVQSKLGVANTSQAAGLARRAGLGRRRASQRGS